jgi:Tfp pilus assembly protein PilX
MQRAARARNKQQGAALLLALFALLLLSAIGALMYLSAITETHVGANYSNSLSAYYAANSGLLEVRDRLKYPASNTAAFGGATAGLADQLPTDIAGNANGVLYVVNNAGAEVVDPTDRNNKYFDTELCHDYNSGVEVGARCTAAPAVPNWNLPVQSALAGANPPPYKWVRINMTTNRIAAPYFVDGDGSTAPLDTPVCWDGQYEQLLPGGTTARCDANGMQNVYMLTSLAATSGLGQNAARRLLRFEVAPPSIRPPGAITMDATNVNPSFGSGLPTSAVDGHVHDIQGGPPNTATGSKCSNVAALATDAPQSSTQFQPAFDTLRFSIVQKANNTCSASGNAINGQPSCPPALWWVRGTTSSPRFVTTIQIPTGNNNSGGPGPSGDGGDGPNYITVPCTSANANCYTHLDLAAPELMATGLAPTQDPTSPVPAVTTAANKNAPFGGQNAASQPADPSVNQVGSATTLQDEIKALNDLVSANTNLPNYYSVTSADLAAKSSSSYGAKGNPAVVVIKPDPAAIPPDPSTPPPANLTLTTPLTGYGVLVVPGDLVINAKLNWTGIVLVKGQFVVGSGSGFINGAVMIQSSTANLITNGSGPGFTISYSCDAIDMAFSSLPYKVVSSSESSF